MEFTSYQPLDTVSVDVQATSHASVAVDAGGTRKTVRLFATVPTCIAIGDNPVAVQTGFELAAFVPEYIDLLGGQKIAAIRAPSATADGKLKITTLTKRS